MHQPTSASHLSREPLFLARCLIMARKPTCMLHKVIRYLEVGAEALACSPRLRSSPPVSGHRYFRFRGRSRLRLLPWQFLALLTNLAKWISVSPDTAHYG